MEQIPAASKQTEVVVSANTPAKAAATSPSPHQLVSAATSPPKQITASRLKGGMKKRRAHKRHTKKRHTKKRRTHKYRARK